MFAGCCVPQNNTCTWLTFFSTSSVARKAKKHCAERAQLHVSIVPAHARRHAVRYSMQTAFTCYPTSLSVYPTIRAQKKCNINESIALTTDFMLDVPMPPPPARNTAPSVDVLPRQLTTGAAITRNMGLQSRRRRGFSSASPSSARFLVAPVGFFLLLCGERCLDALLARGSALNRRDRTLTGRRGGSCLPRTSLPDHSFCYFAG